MSSRIPQRKSLPDDLPPLPAFPSNLQRKPSVKTSTQPPPLPPMVPLRHASVRPQPPPQVQTSQPTPLSISAPTLSQRRDPSALNNMQFAWVSQELALRESEYVEISEEVVIVGTWNVNNKRPSEPLDPWLSSDSNPAIYALGLQEVDMSPEAMLLRETPSKIEPWKNAFKETLNKTETKYKLVSSRQLGGVYLCVFIRSDLECELTGLSTALVATGIMGIMGNKGGVAIRFSLQDSSFCFICSHFNAHQSNVERRNQDYQFIIDGLQFEVGNLNMIHKIVWDHDNIFFLGDLNYRVDLPDAEVRRKIEEKDWNGLWVADQLRVQMELSKVFQPWQSPDSVTVREWNESAINFAPTYKYDANSTEYDTSDKQRIPAWTDRILWNSSYTTQLNYQRHEMLSSDHRPVSGHFKVKIKKIIPEKKVELIKKLVEEYNNFIKAGSPDTKISSNIIKFGHVNYGLPTTQEFTLENVGKVAAQWNFIPKNSPNICKPWLKIDPISGTIIPGAKITIKLTVNVDKNSARSLTIQNEKLIDDIVLRVHNGDDHVIIVEGKFLRSSFGNSLGNLARFPYPVRSNQPLTSFGLKIPKELWRIVDWLSKDGLDVKDLFIEPGEKDTMDNLRECLDTGEQFPENVNAPSMAELLLRFLESMENPVIPFAAYADTITWSNNITQCKAIVSKFPEVHYHCFYYLVAFLKEVLQHSEKNRLTIEQLAVIFSTVMISAPHNTNLKSFSDEEIKQKKSSFLLHFLVSEPQK